jgi:hypothetical protein
MGSPSVPSNGASHERAGAAELLTALPPNQDRLDAVRFALDRVRFIAVGTRAAVS